MQFAVTLFLWTFYSSLDFSSAFIFSTKQPKYREITGQPRFKEPVNNITITRGKTAMFLCTVEKLGGYKVAWLKSDDKMILTMGEVIVTTVKRVQARKTDEETWTLSIFNVQWEDRGIYMCQINTHPIQSQIGYMTVHMPPDIIDEETSGDVMIPEGGEVKLTCRARGYPIPNVSWKREDGKDIIVRYESTGKRNTTREVVGSNMHLTQVSRADMGSYVCIANNGVPPIVSKRINVQVTFSPVMSVRDQLIGAAMNSQVVLQCVIEAFPDPMKFWVRKNDMLLNSTKYRLRDKKVNDYTHIMTLIILHITEEDFGEYQCFSKNSVAQSFTTINLYDSQHDEQAKKSGDVTKYLKEIGSSTNSFTNIPKEYFTVPYDMATTNSPQITQKLDTNDGRTLELHLYLAVVVFYLAADYIFRFNRISLFCAFCFYFCSL